jgi:hypothetical protein
MRQRPPFGNVLFEAMRHRFPPVIIQHAVWLGSVSIRACAEQHSRAAGPFKQLADQSADCERSYDQSYERSLTLLPDQLLRRPPPWTTRIIPSPRRARWPRRAANCNKAGYRGSLSGPDRGSQPAPQVNRHDDGATSNFTRDGSRPDASAPVSRA